MTRNASILAEVESSVSAYLRTGEPCDTCDVVHDRSNGRGMLLRVRTDEIGSVIVKAWVLRNARERLKQLVGISNGRREWRMHCHIRRLGLKVPDPLAYKASSTQGARFEMMAVEDLGKTIRGLQYLKQCIKQSAEEEIIRFEDEVIDMTVQLSKSHIVDVDHQLNNIVVDQHNAVWRIDLECARLWRFGRMPRREYASMICRLVCSHAYAAQPDVERTERFACRLAESLQPPLRILADAKGRINSQLARQREKHGVDSRLTMDW